MSLSGIAGYDIGTPETTRRMLDTSHMHDNDDAREIQNYLAMAGKFGLVKSNLPLLMAVGYLLGADYVSPMTITYPDGTKVKDGILWDEHGKNQLEGELRRFWAREKKTSASSNSSNTS